MTEDTWAGNFNDPVSLNRYTYCYNNPIFYYDPSGNIPSPAQIWNGIKDGIRSGIKIGEQAFNSALVNASSWISNNTSFEISLSSANTGAFILMMNADANGVYHASVNCWQQGFGFNSMYDFFFDVGTSAQPEFFQFSHSAQDYRFWAWKADYLNLGAGAELGIYYKSLIPGHWGVDASLALPMSMTLKDNNGNLIASYSPSEPQWWITSFNPAFQNMKAENLRASFIIDFSTNIGMFNSLRNTPAIAQDNRWIFNMNNYTVMLNF